MKTKHYWIGFSVSLAAGLIAGLQAAGTVTGDFWYFALLILLLVLAGIFGLRAKAASKHGMKPGALMKLAIALLSAVFALLCIPMLRALVGTKVFVAITSVLFALEGLQWIGAMIAPLTLLTRNGSGTASQTMITFLAGLCSLVMVLMSMLGFISAFWGTVSVAFIVWQPAVCLLANAGIMFVLPLINMVANRRVDRAFKRMMR